jgi:hypothetical protein
MQAGLPAWCEVRASVARSSRRRRRYETYPSMHMVAEVANNIRVFGTLLNFDIPSPNTTVFSVLPYSLCVAT